MPTKLKEAPLPKTLGACADLYAELRDKRLAAEKVAQAIETEEKRVVEHIIQNLSKSEEGGAVGKKYRVTLNRKVIPRVADWDVFYKYVKRTGAFELLQRRLSDTAVAERWQAGKEVPGIETFNVVKLGLNKL